MLTIQMCCTCVSAQLLRAFWVDSLFCLAIRVLFWACNLARRLHNLPGHHYEKVQAVPRVSKVTLLAENPQSHHLDHHLNGKECKDEVIKVLQWRKKENNTFSSEYSPINTVITWSSHKTDIASVFDHKHISTQETSPRTFYWKYSLNILQLLCKDVFWSSASLMTSQRAGHSLKKVLSV